MKYIFCNLTMFVANQPVYLVTPGEKIRALASVPYEDLPKVISEACYNHNVNKVNISGNESFASPLVDQIQKYSKLNYKNTDIEVNLI